MIPQVAGALKTYTSSQKIFDYLASTCSGGSSPQNLGGTAPWRARYREPITGVWEQSPQRGPGTEPLVRGSGGEAPWSSSIFWLQWNVNGMFNDVQWKPQLCHFSKLWKHKDIRYLCYLSKKSWVATKLGSLKQNWGAVPPRPGPKPPRSTCCVWVHFNTISRKKSA